MTRRKLAIRQAALGLLCFVGTTLTGCAIAGVSPLSNNDVADIVAPTIAAVTGGDLASVQDLFPAKGPEYSVLPEAGVERISDDTRAVDHTYGNDLYDYSVRFFRDNWQTPSEAGSADRYHLSATATGEVNRSRFTGTFAASASLEVVSGAAPLSSATDITVNGTVYRKGNHVYTNWFDTVRSNVFTDLTRVWRDVTFRVTRSAEGRSLLVPTGGTVTVSGTIDRMDAGITAPRDTEWEGTVTVTFNGTTNASMTFSNGEKKIINLSTGEVVQ